MSYRTEDAGAIVEGNTSEEISFSDFSKWFSALTDFPPFNWQWRLFNQFVNGFIPDAVDLPTGTGKTSVIAIWLLARACNADLPRRLIYVVDRRVVVDQATTIAQQLQEQLRNKRVVAEIAEKLGLEGEAVLPISTLRGQLADNRLWLEDPSKPAVVIGTVDMIGSRLLFSGYRTSRWMRPIHAALLGVDSLIVLDEAHLVPAFNQVLSFALQQRGVDNPPIPLPPLKVLPLSATAAVAEDSEIFRLEDEDLEDELVAKRLSAAKRLRFHELTGDKIKIADELAKRAFEYDGIAKTVSVFCDFRKDAQDTAEALRKKVGKARTGDVRSLTGARRGYERDELVIDKTFKAFQGDYPEDGRTRFLVCTAAGEVGADLDGHQSVMDLVSLERMIQRIGRVNRRGEAPEGSTIDILVDFNQIDKRDGNSLDLNLVWDILESLPEVEEGYFDASPKALDALLKNLRPDCRPMVFTPAPPIPALDRAHLEAWAMTSLVEHPGRPEVGPYLRGVTDEVMQTTIAWRDDVNLLARVEKDSINQAMEAAPLQTSEIIEQSTFSVVETILKRIERIRLKNEDDPLFPIPFIIMRGSGVKNLTCWITEQEIKFGEQKISIDDQKALKSKLIRVLAYATVILPLEFGGLNKDGLFVGTVDKLAHEPPRTGSSPIRLEVDIISGKAIPIGTAWPDEIDEEDKWEAVFKSRRWRCIYGITLPPTSGNSDENPTNRFEIWVPPRAGRLEGETGTAPKAQALSQHHEWARNEVIRLSKDLNVPEWLQDILKMAAGCHDMGKNRDLWQHAMRVELEPETIERPLAKTSNRGCGYLGGYRHEFGSLLDAQFVKEVQNLEQNMRDLLLHLIATHHGRARPVIPPIDPDVILPPVLEGEAMNAALRFAGLQRRWGVWGLAWLESLVRCADAISSRRLEE